MDDGYDPEAQRLAEDDWQANEAWKLEDAEREPEYDPETYAFGEQNWKTLPDPWAPDMSKFGEGLEETPF